MTSCGHILTDLVESSLGLHREYLKRKDGALVVVGTRPGPQWQGHGYFAGKLWVIRCGGVVRVDLFKHRWRHVATGATCHSGSSEEMGRVGSGGLIVVLLLWGWLDSGYGLHRQDRREVMAQLEDFATPRTLQRWLHRLLPFSMAIQQAIRRAVIERCEPRPVETLFPGGLSPPEGLQRHRWQDPPAVGTLWRAFAILIGGATELDVPVALLLTEARGRWSDQTAPAIF